MKLFKFIILLLGLIIFFEGCEKNKEDKKMEQDVTIKVDKIRKENQEEKKKNNTIINPDTELRFVSKGLKEGYIDQNGNVIIDLIYEIAYPFSEGLAKAKLNSNNSGFIDKTGSWVIEPIYGIAENFHEGVASVYKNNLGGFINKNGDIVIDFIFEISGNFSEGLATYGINWDTENEKWGFIDKTGKVVIEPQWDYTGDFKEGLCFVGNSAHIYDRFNPRSYGYIDKTGKLVIPMIYSNAFNFKDGIALVVNDEYGNHFIDKNGEPVLLEKTKDIYVEEFYEGMARFENPQTDKWGFIDKEGKIIIQPGYYAVKDFSEGLAAFQAEDQGLWGYINKAGEVVIEAKYYSGGDFFNGLAKVETLPDYNDYLINKDDKIIWDYQ